MNAGPPLAVTLGVAALVLAAAPAAAHEDPPPSVAPSVAPSAADPHAGHTGHDPAVPAATIDPHAGHAGHGAEALPAAPSDPPRAEVLTGFAAVNAGLLAAGVLVRRYDAGHRRARRLA